MPPVHSPPMTDQSDQGCPEPPLAGDDTSAVLGSLERQRWLFAWKCGGLDAAGLRATLPPLDDHPGGVAQARRLGRGLPLRPFVVRDRGSLARPGTRSTGRQTRTGSGTRRPTTLPTSS